MSKRRTKKGCGATKRLEAGLPEDNIDLEKGNDKRVVDGEDNGDNGKGVLKTIVRQAKKGEAKQQELYLKYIDVFSKTGGDGEGEEVVYETEFVDDKDKED